MRATWRNDCLMASVAHAWKRAGVHPPKRLLRNDGKFLHVSLALVLHFDFHLRHRETSKAKSTPRIGGYCKKCDQALTKARAVGVSNTSLRYSS